MKLDVKPVDPKRLAEAVAALATAIAKGDCKPEILELKALAILCDEQHLYAEAARVRRWLDGATS